MERPFSDGMRKCLVEEFSNIHVINLRGDIRKNMLSKGRAKEGGNVFDSGSMTGIAITFLIKNPESLTKGNVLYHDIGDDLSGAQKLEKLTQLVNSKSIGESECWQTLSPDQYHDWLNHRDDSFYNFMSMGNKKDKTSENIFTNYSRGLESGRDAWCYNSSKNSLSKNISSMIDTYNSEVREFISSDRVMAVKDFVTNDSSKISWTSSLYPKVENGTLGNFDETLLTKSIYRPFFKQWTYYDGMFNHRVGQMPKIYPDSSLENITILLCGKGSRNGFHILISNSLVDLNELEAGTQCFPLYIYEKTRDDNVGVDGISDLFSENTLSGDSGYTRKDGISDEGLAHFQQAYPSEKFNKEDIFYYVYGLLHSPDYRERYADNLSKELPRIPCVKTAKDFWHFSQAGRDLAEFHINYETVDKYPVTLDCGKRTIKQLKDEDFRVTQMKHPRIKVGEKSLNDNSIVIYNQSITVRDIPLEAYDYIVNGKSAITWVIERQRIKADKNSGIVNDANDWAIDTMNNPRYPLELLLRVITVSIETNKIVNSLPPLDID